MMDKCPKCGADMIRHVGGTGNGYSTYHTPGETVCMSNQLTQAKAKIAELLAVVDQLPKTKDGVTVTPNMDEVFHPDWEESTILFVVGPAAQDGYIEDIIQR